ncbi:C6 finger domain-containing protein [Colletotrichum asianum]
MQNLTVGESSGSQQLVPVPKPAVTALARSDMTRELPLTAFRDTMAFSHLLANYRWGPFWKPLLRTSMSEASAPAERAHYRACLATALAFMGKAVNEPKMLSDGYEMNGEVIRGLHRALLQQSKSEMARWAFTIIVLCMYQYAVEGNANLPHYYGVVRVIEYCGPEYFQQEPMLTIYRQIRAQHVSVTYYDISVEENSETPHKHRRKLTRSYDGQSCSSFNNKKPSFFNIEKWKTIPWMKTRKTSYDILIDLYIELPGLGASLGPSSATLSKDDKIEIEMETRDLLARFYEWRRNWELENPRAAAEVWLPITADDVPQPWVKDLLSIALEVQTADQVTDLLVYDSALIYLMHILYALRTGDRRPQPFPTDMDATVQKTARDPLYMPDELKYQWQPAIEALRLMRLAPGLLSISDCSVMVPVSPIGIIYNSLLGNEGLGRVLLSTMNNPKDYEMAGLELSVFRIPE